MTKENGKSDLPESIRAMKWLEIYFPCKCEVKL